MFDRYTYLGYTLLFCLPPIVLLWLRAEFARVMRRDLKGILLATAAITVYGSAIWPLAMRWHCWSYAESRILNLKLFGYVFAEDVVWWALVSFLCASFVSLCATRDGQGRDTVVRELLGLSRAFRNAAAGFRAMRLERNTAIHAAAAVAAVAAACLFRLPRTEWPVLILAIAGVLAAELMNCAVERLAPRPDEHWSGEVRLLKDAAAAGVLVMALAAAAIGVAVFLPRVLAAFQ